MNDSSGTSRAPKWMRVLLIGSLALNLLVVSLFAGVMLRRDGPVGRSFHARDIVTPYARAVHEDDRRNLGRELRKAWRAARPDLAALKADYDTILTLLRADELDRAQLSRVLDVQAERGRVRQGVGQNVLLNYLAGLSVEERRAYADRLEQEIARAAARRHPPRP